MKDRISCVAELLRNASFLRWVKGNAPKSEADRWDRWCRSSKRNNQLAKKAQHELLGVTPRYRNHTDVEEEWALLRDRISKKHRSNIVKKKRITSIVWWYRSAAVILVAAVVGLVFQMLYVSAEQPEQKIVTWKEIKTAYGEQKTITLSDTSSIILSANSSLKYPVGWIQNEAIEVQLDGGAYFNITHRGSPDKPSFKVKTPDGVVRVMGTKFFVSSDSEEKQTRVVLEEGAVFISRRGGQGEVGDGIHELELEPAQLAEFSRFEKNFNVKKINPEVYTSWIRHVLVLDNTPFSFLTDKIKKTYGVRVIIKDAELTDRRLTGTVNFTNLDLLIQAISDVLSINVTRAEGTVIFG